MKALITFLAIIFLVILHELGHFAAGRLFKIPVSEFSIGFGPLLFQKQGKKETAYSLRAIPLGGYCAFADESETADNNVLENVHPLKRILVFLAGPLMNFIACYVLVFIVCGVIGLPNPTLVVDSTMSGYPSSELFEENDKFLSINGIDLETSSDVVPAFAKSAPEFTAVIERNGKVMTIEGELKAIDVEGGIYETGIVFKQKPVRLPLSEAVVVSFRNTAGFVKELVNSLLDIVKGKTSISEMSSLVGIVNVVSHYATQSQLPTLLFYLAFISINLGVINLLPIPGLDGSHVVMDVVLMITKRRVPENIYYWASMISFAALISFTFIMMIKDTLSILG